MTIDLRVSIRAISGDYLRSENKPDCRRLRTLLQPNTGGVGADLKT
jgi:hypothetical protein